MYVHHPIFTVSCLNPSPQYRPNTIAGIEFLRQQAAQSELEIAEQGKRGMAAMDLFESQVQAMEESRQLERAGKRILELQKKSEFELMVLASKHEGLLELAAAVEESLRH
jgi:outer membrane protein assembly factor BamD (BamD/ComL family)